MNIKRIQYQAFAGPLEIIPDVVPDIPLDAWFVAPTLPVRRKRGRPFDEVVVFDVVAAPDIPIDIDFLMQPILPRINRKPLRGFGGLHVEPLAVPIYMQSDARGRYRIANNAQSLYELYVGVGTAPNLSGSPTATSATLPFTHSLSAGSTYYVVVRRRNAYGLVSGNIKHQVITINGGGVLVRNAPSAPQNVLLSKRPGGKVLVRADYVYAADGADQGDTWAVYIRSNGTNPDPSTDTPATITMKKNYQIEPLYYTTGAYSNGADVRVLVRSRRASDLVESTNTTPTTITADATGPAFSTGPDAFGQNAFRQD